MGLALHASPERQLNKQFRLQRVHKRLHQDFSWVKSCSVDESANSLLAF